MRPGPRVVNPGVKDRAYCVRRSSMGTDAYGAWKQERIQTLLAETGHDEARL